ncbi:MAG: carbohydrate kinase, partial [Verrucomicrobiae bacterium]|nr:carbohydrate kinase [Verrucomicrobiae bacterium]
QTLGDNGIGVAHLLEVPGFPTITKTRVVARHQQVVRIDHERKTKPDASQIERILAELKSLAPSLDGIIIEDYGKGLVTQDLVDAVCAVAKEAGVLVTVDPNPKNPIAWAGVATVKPNRIEAFQEAGIEDPHDGTAPLEDEALLEVGRRLLEKWRSDHVLITLGEQGMLLMSAGSDPFHIPTMAKEVFDVSGAGDTAIAVFTMALCAGADARVAAQLSNQASGIVVGKLGTAPVERGELRKAVAAAGNPPVSE